MVRRGLRVARSRARGGQVARIARAAALRAVQSKAEKKHKEIDAVGSIANTGVDFNLMSIAQGVGDTQRVGNKVTTTGIYHKVMLSHNYANTQHETVRVIMYIPKNVADSMSTDPTPPGVNDNIDFNKYTVLYDRKVCLNQYKPCSTMVIRKRWAKKGLGIEYTGAQASTIIKNKVQVYYVSDQPANQPRYSHHGETWFTDM